MGRRIGALAGVMVAGMLASGCSLFDEIHGRYRMDIGATSPSSPWLAAWTAEPSELDQGLLNLAGSECRTLGGDTAPRERVVTDQRGPDAVAILWADADQTMFCLAARTYGSVHSHILGGFMTDAGAVGQLTTVDGECGNPTLVTGFVPAGTDSLVIETASGREVTASVAGGRFLAWWPGPDRPVALRTEHSIADLVDGVC
jgi:hypothetical protein